jgi:hypothetical protein
MKTVWGVECASHRRYRAGKSAKPLSPGGAALARGYLHAVPLGRKTAFGRQTGAKFTPSLLDERLHLNG